mmetsp:Transcript_11964/g.34160  ORF Transcript_11964/g.34160 Transcript_11964/m.34160 type:complete len:214 (+) Transcript_11964:355-996(+)
MKSVGLCLLRFAWAPSSSCAAQVTSSACWRDWYHCLTLLMSLMGPTCTWLYPEVGTNSYTRLLSSAISSNSSWNRFPEGSGFLTSSSFSRMSFRIRPKSSFASSNGCDFKLPRGWLSLAPRSTCARSCWQEPTLRTRRKSKGASFVGSRRHFEVASASFAAVVGSYLISCIKYLFGFLSKCARLAQSLPALLLNILQNSASAFSSDSNGVRWN